MKYGRGSKHFYYPKYHIKYKLTTLVSNLSISPQENLENVSQCNDRVENFPLPTN